MSERDNDPERFDDAEDVSNQDSCTCGENEACDSCPDTDDEEERPISVDLTRSEAITLLHVAWEKEIEMSSEASTAGLARLMGSVGTQVGKEIYGEEMSEWLLERQEEKEELMEDMRERISRSSGSGSMGGSNRLGFQ